MNLGHADQYKTDKAARQRFRWPDIKRDAITPCNNCARVARLEGRAVNLMRMMTIGSANVVAGDFMREVSLLYETCDELRGVGCGIGD